MTVRLEEISDLRFGYYTKPKEKGEIAYLQAKNFDEVGNSKQDLDNFLDPDPKNRLHLLNEGDILLIGKGNKNSAWVYKNEFGPAIASSIFFVIRPNQKKVLPEYLTIIFNTIQTQTYFQALGAGSSIPSIRKSELEAFTFILPPLALQEKIVGIKRLQNKELQLCKIIIAEKEKRNSAVINKLINEEIK
ncbi:Type I restriction modification DNA specificity domain-containing protein [Rhodonellum ikkaensis]|nr:Type I restriction modification DNA specificity domain-containing protein [Rhodonellum ikkaensis]